MVTVQSILRQVPDPRVRRGRQHRLFALLGLIMLSLMNGRKDMKAAFQLGQSLSRHQLTALGFLPDYAPPSHFTLQTILRILDPDAMALVFNQVTVKPIDKTAVDNSQFAIDGKTLRGSKDVEGKAEHVLSAFCAWLEQSVGHTSSCGKGMEVPDALKLIIKRDLSDKRELTAERTRARMAAARARGLKIGRPRSMDATMLRDAMKAMADRETSAVDLAKRLRISRTTLYEYVNGDGSAKALGQKLLLDECPTEEPTVQESAKHSSLTISNP